MVLTIVWEKGIPANLSRPLRAKLLLDAMQEFLRVRGQNNLLGIKQTAFKEGAPDAISMLVIDRVDDVVKDHDRTIFGKILCQQNRETETPDMPLAQDLERINYFTWLTSELELDSSVLSQGQPECMDLCR